ncbi:hypothetical protein AV530_001681 [Patagioenas fasciata monilis]|uniref:Uncharacterized protein n=1 Tax=Patagioenas fasciata monilis TaxID=372326 RepID=A0A1V4KM30_PATFA|nr:hypothetical protein AV530_001681 [Patagioenas fasciata monilis]
MEFILIQLSFSQGHQHPAVAESSAGPGTWIRSPAFQSFESDLESPKEAPGTARDPEPPSGAGCRAGLTLPLARNGGAVCWKRGRRDFHA